MFWALAPTATNASTPAAMTFRFTYPPRQCIDPAFQSIHLTLECEGELLRGGYIGVKTALFHHVLSLRKCENKVAARIELALRANRPAMSLHHVPCNREPQSSSSRLS